MNSTDTEWCLSRWPLPVHTPATGMGAWGRGAHRRGAPATVATTTRRANGETDPRRADMPEEVAVPRFMDVHDGMIGITPEALSAAHAADLAIQADEGVTFEHAWADPASGLWTWYKSMVAFPVSDRRIA